MLPPSGHARAVPGPGAEPRPALTGSSEAQGTGSQCHSVAYYFVDGTELETKCSKVGTSC